jgi:hypothetical protein
MALGRPAGPMEAAMVMPLVRAVVAVGTGAALADRSMHFVAVKQTNRSLPTPPVLLAILMLQSESQIPMEAVVGSEGAAEAEVVQEVAGFAMQVGVAALSPPILLSGSQRPGRRRSLLRLFPGSRHRLETQVTVSHELSPSLRQSPPPWSVPVVLLPLIRSSPSSPFSCSPRMSFSLPGRLLSSNHLFLSFCDYSFFYSAACSRFKISMGIPTSLFK